MKVSNNRAGASDTILGSATKIKDHLWKNKRWQQAGSYRSGLFCNFMPL